MSETVSLDPMVPLVYRVRHSRRELPDIATLELVPLAGEAPSFLPGQFTMLYAFGVGEVAISMSAAVWISNSWLQSITPTPVGTAMSAGCRS